METPRTGLAAILFSALLKPLLFLAARSSAPRYAGERVVPGLERTVTVHWDDYGVPRVRAEGERDLFIAQGYLHAHERLWQMDMNRRFLSGRLAEIFGSFPVPWRELSVQFRACRSADFDYFVRLLGIRRSAEVAFERSPEDDRERLRAYCEGVNRYIEDNLKRLPWEFRLLRYEPEPWSPVDTLTIAKGFALLLSTALFSRLNMIAIARRLGDQNEIFSALRPRSAAAPAVVAAAWDGAARAWTFTGAILGDLAAGHGSNAWAVSGKRSATGKAILANDPHLRMTLPSVWYLMGLRAGPAGQPVSYDVWGASIPGAPCIHIGHNRRIAWGVTAALCDDVELYRERLHRLDPELYLTPTGWERMERREEVVRVRGAAPLRKIVRSTRHGPVLSDFSEAASSTEVLSLRWTAHEASQELAAVYHVNRAEDWPAFLRALSHHGAPTLNYLFADIDGNIGYSLAGKVPLRAAAPPLLPLEGWRKENDWLGYAPFEELPRLFNPPEGIIASANHPIADASYPRYLSHFFEPPYRIERIRRVLAEKRELSPDDCAALQLDVVSLHARELLAALRPDLEAAAARRQGEGELARLLLGWDGSCTVDSVPAAIFHALHQKLMAALLLPVLGEELMPAYLEVFNQCLLPLGDILKDPESPWFRRVSRTTLVSRCLREVHDEMVFSLGPELDRWRWGRIHTLTLDHPLSRVAALKPLLSIGPSPAPGDGVTVNLGFYRHSNPYRQVVGASLRFIVELDSPPRFRYVLPSGQSGHWLSPHYRDQHPLWAQGRLLSDSGTEARASAHRVLTLSPEPLEEDRRRP
ncbi:MAG TPA: penicillin acylase family protein [candidate division Zixibacteria bacterium]|nr:penicillin acylase family protein [candidate division Zixibacteria bacterium]